MSQHVIMFSGGITSWAAGKRIAEQHGTDGIVLLFADTKIEDEDTYRFLPQAAASIGAPLITIADGRDVWQVFHDERYLGNTRIDPCSKILKLELLRRWVEANCDPADTTIVLGLDWSEGDRLTTSRSRWAPWTVAFPLAERPYQAKHYWLDRLRAEGIEPPRLYAMGFAHGNCFTPDTRFITSAGVRRLAETVGTTVEVLGRGGGWHQAEIRAFGRQPIWELRLRRYADERVVHTTSDHRWFRRLGRGNRREECNTADLRPGDHLLSMFGQLGATVRPSAFGIAHGIVYGDGTCPSTTRGPASVVLCGEKDAVLLKWFPHSPTKAVPGVGIEVRDLPRGWKQRPSLEESRSYLYGWLAGYFAADGTVTAGQVRINSASRDDLAFVREVAVRLGVATNPIRSEIRLGFPGRAASRLYSLTFIPSTLRDDFFLIPAHRDRFSGTARHRPAEWQVASAVNTGRMDEVMCAVVGDGQVFTLEDNLLTSNCGGFCIKAGQGHFALLLEAMPECYAEHERREQELCDYLGKDVAVLRDREGGETRPLTLREFRQRREAGQQCDLFDIGGCGCVA